jgi:hypothetical protein
MTDHPGDKTVKTSFGGIFRSDADAFKIGTAYLIGAAGVVYCFYAAATDGSDHVLQGLICIFGGAVGWCVGLYFTPTNEGEKEQLSDASKALLALASGFGLGKIPEITHALSEWFPGKESESALRLLLFFVNACHWRPIHLRFPTFRQRRRRSIASGTGTSDR